MHDSSPVHIQPYTIVLLILIKTHVCIVMNDLIGWMSGSWTEKLDNGMAICV